ncbi:MAG TPA: YciI family protein [Actinoplanes sp.]
MQYALLIYGDEKAWEARDEREKQENHERHGRFMEMLRARGALVGGEELNNSASATTVRNGGVGVTDGPYAETAEQLGGFYLVEAADLDEAIALAKQVPEPIVEIRPVVAHPDM